MQSDEAWAAFADDHGYVVQEHDLEFLDIRRANVDRLVRGETPLGMSGDEFEFFTKTLEQAVNADRLLEVDIRLKGSSVKFFSGFHKKMLYEEDELVSEFRSEHARFPHEEEIRNIISKMEQQWPAEKLRPGRRLFDSMHKLRISRRLSDYDLQISSDEILQRAEVLAGQYRRAELGILVRDPNYDCIEKDLFARACPAIEEWRILQSDSLLRPVTIAAFPSGGPPDVSNRLGELSSHHRDSDWKIIFGYEES